MHDEAASSPFPVGVPGRPAGDAIIDLRDVRCSSGGREIFLGLSLTIARGRVTAIMGPSGVGKTRLLHLITGKVQADAGKVLVEDHAIAGLSQLELYCLHLRMGVLFQQGALFTGLNVFDNVAFAVREHTNLPEDLIRALVLMKLQAVGLRGAAALMAAELSGGMARRVALARAMVMDPAMLLCDEPFTGLDPIATGVIVRLLRQLNEALGITVIIVTHDVPAIENLAHMSYLLANGRVVAAGTPNELRDNAQKLRCSS
jgi:phospholipid/cholesterol/gamma-HCH transport system ATP-binding protein